MVYIRPISLNLLTAINNKTSVCGARAGEQAGRRDFTASSSPQPRRRSVLPRVGDKGRGDAETPEGQGLHSGLSFRMRPSHDIMSLLLASRAFKI